MIPAQNVKNSTYAILGLGRSGLSAAAALKAGGAKIFCLDDNINNLKIAEELGYACTVPNQINWNEIDVLLVSPGVPHNYPKPHIVVSAAIENGVAIDNDIGLFFRSIGSSDWEKFGSIPKIIAVTGSNGKSTTSALIHHILQCEKRPSQLTGNIGKGVFDLEPLTDGETVILELSSYQTEVANSLTPDVAVFTNFTPDHLERHGGIGGYYAAKKRLFISGCPDRSVIGVDEFEGKLLAQELADHLHDDRIIRVSGSRKITNLGWTVFANKGFLSEYRRGKQLASLDLREFKALQGSHNHQNACAAYAVVRSLGIGPRSIAKALKSFTGLAHRSQLVNEISGVVFINDSKATNVESAMKSLETFPKVRWICGGEQKEEDISRLNNVLTNVKKAYVIGTNTAKFSSQISCEFEICNTMDIAVKKAFNDASDGETVLLAPATASFDQYSSFEERGKAFEYEIKKLM
tara:strand:+ start:812 stop:2203 length:1392 start_codon:yes stop_codon:yes gene_type:complete